MLETAAYAPIVYARTPEVRAFRELPEHTKDVLFPTFVARPWPNAKELSLCFERIAQAVGERPYGLDLDRAYPVNDEQNPGKADFAALRSPTNAFCNYFDLLGDLKHAIPVLQFVDDGPQTFAEQIERMKTLGRGGLARFRPQHTALLTEFVAALDAVDPLDLAVIIDAGWRRDILQQQGWTLTVTERLFEQAPERPLVICSSSFPDDFSKVKSELDFDIDERVLFNVVRDRYNARLVYGDWGSCREPTFDNSVKRTVPRIDVSFMNFWRVFRSEKIPTLGGTEDYRRETYQEIASRAIENNDWEDIPQIWGSYIIECTAQGLETGIKSPSTAASARANMHYYMQSVYNTPQQINDTDDPYID